ncbi:hypothetical protein FSP39_013144 [Pinctada imbricata]|uniref:Aminotransferase class I/classII large domain-containing protein n=1 Tax=Pinctada imbricata TaxID=66713 RepID=A0AA88YJ63_PINIB|nr:hypothetical protein FSP39_013144 [Pinctada imbricata]
MTTNEKKDLFQDLEFYNDESDIIPLSMGAPGPEALAGCNELMFEATKLTLGNADEDRFVFQYGPLKGDPRVLQNLANFLSEEYGDKVNSDNLILTAGATQGLHLVATVMVDEDSVIFVEDPTYFIAIQMFVKDFKFKVVPVPTDEFGINVDEFEKLLKTNPGHGTKSPFKSMLYCMTVLSNPSGKTLPKDRCEKLIHLARQHDVLLFTEDVYNLLNYSENKHSPPRLLTYDRESDPDFKGHVISNCTFSKILAPGMRLGWIESSRRIIEILRKSNITWSGGCFNHYTSCLLGTAIQQGLMGKHLRKLKDLYKERMDKTCELMEKHFPPSIKFTNPKGGFFIWLEFPKEINTSELLIHSLEKYRVGFITGESTSPTKSYKNCLRLAISFCTVDKIETGIMKLAKAIQDFIKQ